MTTLSLARGELEPAATLVMGGRSDLSCWPMAAMRRCAWSGMVE